MEMRKLIAGALGMSLLVAAVPGVVFAQDEATDSLSPEGVEWTLSTLAGGAVPVEVETTLFLSGGEVIGNAGCNSYFGSYELDGDALTFPNPFGVTQRFCDGPAMEVEDAYLPLLQATATWSIDEEGALSLADEAGSVQLVYGEAPIDVTATDVDALVATLGDLQAQIDEASAEVAALTEAAASINVNKLDKRIATVEKGVTDLQKKAIASLQKNVSSINNLKKRISANEKAIASLQKNVSSINNSVNQLKKTVDSLKQRVTALEKTDKDHEARIKLLEENVPIPEPA